jgi:hypothetical protein
MRRVTMRAAVAVAGAALALPTLATAASSASSSAPSEAGADDGADPSAVKGPRSWTKISKGNVYSPNEPGLYRTGDGVLHVAYARGSGNPSLAWSNVSKHGRLVGRGTILSGWDAYSSQPKLIAGPNNRIRVVFGGIDAAGPAPYNDNGLFTSTARNAGRRWNLAPGALTRGRVGTYGIGALAMSRRAPIVAVAFNERIYWRQTDGSATPTTPDNRVSNGSCCAYHSALARDAKNGRVYLGWYSGGGANRPGSFVKRLRPSGPKVKAPDSSRLDPDQTVALTGRRDARGVYAAYCTGYPNCRQVKLWRVGANRAITVPRSRNADTIALAAAPKGRLWVAWENDVTDRVYATLTNRKATRFGAVRVVKSAQRDTYRLAAYSGAVRHLDVVINTGGELFHRQLLPGLKLTAKPRRFDNDGRHVVTFRVTDAGAALAGVKVRVAGKSKVTNAKGKVRIVFRNGVRPGRYHATAAKGGYAKGHVTIRVRQ